MGAGRQLGNGGAVSSWLEGITDIFVAGMRKPRASALDLISGVTHYYNEVTGRHELTFSGGGTGGGSGLVVSGTPAVGQVPKWNGTDAVWSDLDAYALGFSVTTSLVETGQNVVNPTFSATHTDPPTSLVLTNNYNVEAKNVLGTPTSFFSSQTYQRTTPNQTVVFTLTGSDGITVAVRTATMTWCQKNFWGVSSTPANTEAFIEGLATSALDTNVGSAFGVTAGGSNKIYFAHPTRYGTPTFTVGGFAGGFILRSSTISVTNAQGFTENYSLWESVNAGLGATNVTVS